MRMDKVFTHVETKIFEDLSAETSDTGRKYRTPVGDLPSVTTVVGWEKRKFFAKWRKENPHESKRVTSRGNHLHAMIEDYINNELDREKYDGETNYLFNSLQPELDKIDNIHAVEVPLWSEATMLAGRVDCIGEYNGKMSVIDFKGSTRNKRKEDIDNYFMQATAYAIMWQERTGIKIDNIAILMSCEDGTVSVFESSPMKHTRDLFECIRDYKKTLV